MISVVYESGILLIVFLWGDLAIEKPLPQRGFLFFDRAYGF